MMKCYRCGYEIKNGETYYSHYFKSANSYQPVCQECWDDCYWSDVLNNPDTLVIDGFAYCKTNSAKTGGYGHREFTVQILKTGEIKKVGLWLNGKIPEVYQKEDTAKLVV